MNAWLWWFLLVAGPVAAQRPTAEVARPPAGFWPIDALTGAVSFTNPVVHPTLPPLAQAERARAWLTATCERWGEVQLSADSAQLYQGQLRGHYPGVNLTFALRLSRHPRGWTYRLFACQVSSPTRAGDVHWLPLHRLLDDPDFRPEISGFQQQLQRALPKL